MPVAADSKDDKIGLQIENGRVMFLSFSFVSQKNCQKLTMVCSPFDKIILFPSLDAVGVFCVREKAFHLNFSTVLPQNIKIPVIESI